MGDYGLSDQTEVGRERRTGIGMAHRFVIDLPIEKKPMGIILLFWDKCDSPEKSKVPIDYGRL